MRFSANLWGCTEAGNLQYNLVLQKEALMLITGLNSKESLLRLQKLIVYEEDIFFFESKLFTEL